MKTWAMNSGRSGFVFVLVSVGLFALAGGAALLSVAINSSNNRRTLEVLSNPDATSAELDSVSDQDLTNLRNDFVTNASLMTNYSSLGTPTLPNGGSAVEVAGNAIEEQIRNVAVPQVTDYMSNPSSSWNRNQGGDRPGDGILPTGGVLPEDLPGGTGDVRLTLQWSAPVDLDLHVIDPCDNEIDFSNTSATCQGGTGQLDVDDTSGGPGSVENIFWPTNGAPSGRFEYWVHCYSGCDDDAASYTLSRTVDGQRRSTTGTLVADDAESQHVTFNR